MIGIAVVFEVSLDKLFKSIASVVAGYADSLNVDHITLQGKLSLGCKHSGR